MKVTLIKPFKYAESATKIVSLEPGDHDLPEDIAKLARECGAVDRGQKKLKPERIKNK